MPQLAGVEHHFLDVRGACLHVAELGPAEKNAISHRGQAFRALAPTLARALG